MFLFDSTFPFTARPFLLQELRSSTTIASQPQKDFGEWSILANNFVNIHIFFCSMATMLIQF